jgi:YfiH family protein
MHLFDQFPELRIGIFGQNDTEDSDEKCGKTLGFDRTAKLHQVHGNIIHIVDEPTGFETQGDGLITNTQGLALSVRWADCQSFVIYAPEKKVLGVLHAGWRGMAAKAITALYESLKTFDVTPEETYVGISPSLCKNCADFSDPLNELPAHMHPFVDGKLVDLQAAADHELASLNVPKDHIERHPACTRCGEGYWSWRRDKKEDARNWLVAGMA